MEYQFSAAAEALRAAGQLIQPTTDSGELLPYLISKATGKIFELAKAATTEGAPVAAVASVNPQIAAALGIGKLALGAVKSCQNQAALQALSSLTASVATLQATTVVIGVGVAGVAVLAAVNLWQTRKLRKNLERFEAKFDVAIEELKQQIKEQGTAIAEEINEHLDQVAQDIKAELYRKELYTAYGNFSEGIRHAQAGLKCEDLSIRNDEFQTARHLLSKALATYKHLPHFEETCAAGRLRRFECIWAIEQAVITIFQLQGQLEIVRDRLSELQNQIRQDSVSIVDYCKTEEELDFLFPEITQIHNHDLATLKVWQEQVDWARSLPPAEQNRLQEIDSSQPEITETSATVDLAIPPEQLLYESLKEKSHFSALCDALRLMMHTETRREYETYISQQAENAEHKALTAANLQQMSDLSVANLYWYFQVRDESEQEPTEEKVRVGG